MPAVAVPIPHIIKFAMSFGAFISTIRASVWPRLRTVILGVGRGLRNNWLPATGVTVSVATLLFGTGLLETNAPDAASALPQAVPAEPAHNLNDRDLNADETDGTSVAQLRLLTAAEMAWANDADIDTALELLRRYLEDGPVNDRVQPLRNDLRLGLLAEVRQALDAGDPDEARKLLDIAANEWDGDDAFAELRIERRMLVDQLAAGKELETLIGLGEKQLASDNLGTPAGESAADYFRRALDLDPGSERATEGLKRVAERYVTLIQSALERGELVRARLLHSRLANVAPSHWAVDGLQGSIEAAEMLASAAQERKVDVTAATAGAPAAVSPLGPAIADDEEGRLWSAVMDDCSAGQLSRYIDAYPAGRYVEEAWRRRSACLEAR